MRITRRFLLAPPLARLIEREREGHHVTEGYFPEQGSQSVFVRVGESVGSLVLVTNGPNEPIEEYAALSRSQAQFLIDSTTLRVDYRRIDLSIGTRAVQICRFFAPRPLDLILVELEQEEAGDFQLLPWFGAEVTAEARYRNRSIAIAQVHETPVVEITNLALNSLLDDLEGQSSPWHSPDLAPTMTHSGAQQSNAVSSSVSEPERDEEDQGIEDAVIRELASALRPQRR